MAQRGIPRRLPATGQMLNDAGDIAEASDDGEDVRPPGDRQR